MKKIILILLLSGSLLTCFAGCAFSSQTPEPTEAPTECPVDEMRFTAKTFAQQAALSWVYSLEVRVCEGKVYLNDVLYEKVEKVSDPEITFAEDIIGLSDVYISEEVSEVLGKMKNSDNCYILDTESNSNLDIKIAVYEIDGNYYFATAYDGVVERIHVAILEQEVKNKIIDYIHIEVEGVQLIDLAEKMATKIIQGGKRNEKTYRDCKKLHIQGAAHLTDRCDDHNRMRL